MVNMPVIDVCCSANVMGK